jgi:hypothetical protein
MKQFYSITCFLTVAALNGTAQLTNSGNLKLAPGAAVTIFGNVTNNGTVTDSATIVTLGGTSPQQVDGSSVTLFNNLRLNNATGVTLGQTMRVRGTLTFTAGTLTTTSANLLVLENNAAATGASNNSFVAGPVAKIGSQAFVFPTGKNSVYAPIAMGAPALVTDRFTAEYFQASPNALYNVSSKEILLDHVSQCEYWMLDRTAGSSNVAVTLSWDTRSCGVSNLADLRVARWDGTQWTDKGNGGTTGNTTAGTVVSSAAVTGFGPFTLASSTMANSLPVELIDFSAYCDGSSAVLSWHTASENNNAYFTIERSTDGLDWKPVKNVPGAGNSTALLAYTHSDPASPLADAYYRLTQTDLNGHTTEHDIVYLESCLGESPESAVTVYPNPSKGDVYVASTEAISSIAVFQSDGKPVSSVEISIEDKSIDFSQVPEGIYFLEIVSGGKSFRERVVISGH